MVVATRKFSEFSDGGDLENNNITVGIESGVNTKFNNPWTFLASGNTASRPEIAPSMYFRLRLNTELQSYEYYNSVLETWVTLSSNTTLNGPLIIYESFPGFPDAFNLGSLSSGILKQTVAGGSSTPAIATNGVDYYGPGMTGSLYAPSGIEDINGNFVVTFSHVFNGTNGTFLSNATTGQAPSVGAFGADTNIDFLVKSQNAGYVGLYSKNTTIPFKLLSGTNAQHITNLLFSDTPQTRNVTFQDASGTLAFISDIPSSYVASLQGTSNQVLVNGTFGSPQTGVLTVTTPQNIGTSDSPTFQNLNLTGANILNGSGKNYLAFGFNGAGSPVNYLQINNSSTGNELSYSANGTDANIGISTICKGGGNYFIYSQNVNPLIIKSGTGNQHTSIFSFANTNTSTTITFQDANGTVAFLSDIPVSVSSLTGTANQVLVNGTSGSPQTGAITLTLPQDIDTTSSPIFDAPTFTAPILGSSSATSIFFSSTAGIIGTLTNDSADSGSVGEIIEISNITPVSLTTNTEADLASLVLDPGDYMVYGVGSFAVMGGAGTRMVAGLSKTSVTIGGINEYAAIETSTNNIEAIFGPTSLSVPVLHVQVAAATTQTVYLVGKAVFSVDCFGYGRIIAERIR